jgi:hypothetical protein
MPIGTSVCRPWNIRHVIQTMPASTEIERRDRALVALTILTGARDGAIASLKLKHIDIDQGRVDQDARQVKTKFSKSFATWFFPVGEDIRRIVVDWVTYLRHEKLWGLDDPLFRQRRSWLGTVGIFEASASTASIGAAPVPSGLFSRVQSCGSKLGGNHFGHKGKDNPAETRSREMGFRIE